MFLVDTNIFLEIMLAQRKRDECAQFLNLVRDGKQKAAVTDFTIYSIMIILDGAGRLRELRTFLSSLSAYRGLTIYATLLEDKLDAVRFAIEGKLDVDDALQYASASRLKVEGIVSLDKHFDGRDIPRIEPASLITSSN